MESPLPLLTRAVSSLCHAYPFLSGCGRLANTPPLRWLAPSGEAEARLRDGARMQVPLDDHVGRSVYFFGDLDPKLTALCARLLRPGDTVLDIGANLGLVSLLAAGMVGPTGQVHAFEPQPALARRFRRSLAANGYRHVEVHPVALGREDGTLTLDIPADNRGAASLVRSRGGRRVDVPVRDASALFDALDLGPVRLVKIDVEGFEAEVLGGARRYFAAHPPDALVFELNDGSTQPFAERPVVRLLNELGYGFLDLRRELLRLRLRRVPFDARETGHDILALRRGAPYRELCRRLGVR